MNKTKDLWQKIRAEVQQTVNREPLLENFLRSTVLNHATLEESLGHILAGKLDSEATPAITVRTLFEQAARRDPQLGEQLCCDIYAVLDRDSACRYLSQVLLYNKGFHSLSAWRMAHYFWLQNRRSLALVLQNRISVTFGVDIHPAATIGKGIMFDHATGIVVGETAVIDDCVSIMQSVTLGGTGKEAGDRHPKVHQGVLIGPGAKILGNIDVGEGSKVAASSVVLSPVPPHSIVAGVPARVIGSTKVDEPALEMDQGLNGCRCD